MDNFYSTTVLDLSINACRPSFQLWSLSQKKFGDRMSTNRVVFISEVDECLLLSTIEVEECLLLSTI